MRKARRVLDVQTYLAQRIEMAYSKIPDKAYTILTQIARDMSQILDPNSSVRLPAEYEYMLETMAQENIPSSIDYYLNFSKDDPEALKEMEDLFIEQLEIILKSVESVQKEVRSLMISQMKSHSRFIQGKFAEIAPDSDIEQEEEETLFEAPITREAVSIESVSANEEMQDMRVEAKRKQPAAKKSRLRSFFGV